MALTNREVLEIAEACEKTSLEIGRVPTVDDEMTAREQNVFRKHLRLPLINDTDPPKRIRDISDDVEREIEGRRQPGDRDG